MNPAKQTWVNINLVRLACYIVNDKFTPHTKLLILTENVQEIINSGFYLLKEVSLLRDNDGIWKNDPYKIIKGTWSYIRMGAATTDVYPKKVPI